MFPWIEPIKKALDIVDKAVPDKDLREELRTRLQESENAMRVAALQTPTIPWIDAFYKIAPALGAAAHMAVCVGLVIWKPDIEPEILVAMGAPGGVVALKGIFRR